MAKIPHCFAYKSFCFTAVLFALNVLLFQQLFIEPLYLQRGIARASGQSYQRIDSCGGGLCRDSFPSFDSVYQARSWSVWTASAFISAKQSRKHSKADRQTNTRLFSGRNFYEAPGQRRLCAIGRCVLAGFFKSISPCAVQICVCLGLSAVPCIWNFRMAEAQMTAFNLRESFRRYRVSVYIGAVGSPFHPEPSCRTSTYCSRDLENTISKLRIWRIVYGSLLGNRRPDIQVLVIWSRMQRPMY